MAEQPGQTPSGPIEARASRTTFVYDTATGKVVHVHQFIPATPGGTCSDEEMAETAMALAPSAYARDAVDVLHADEVELVPGHVYRVDVERRTVVAEPLPADTADVTATR
jgi:hypothetical protein